MTSIDEHIYEFIKTIALFLFYILVPINNYYLKPNTKTFIFKISLKFQ